MVSILSGLGYVLHIWVLAPLGKDKGLLIMAECIVYYGIMYLYIPYIIDVISSRASIFYMV